VSAFENFIVGTKEMARRKTCKICGRKNCVKNICQECERERHYQAELHTQKEEALMKDFEN